MPLSGVAVAVEDHRLVVGDDLLQEFLDGARQFGLIAAGRRLQFRGDEVEAVGHDRVECHERAGDRLAGPDRPELELVARERKRAGPVAVAGVLGQRGECVDADGQRAGRLGTGRLSLFDLLEDVGELLAQEDRDDGRRSLVGTEPMVVAAGGDHGAEQVTVEMDGTNHRGAEHEELHVGMGRLTRLEQVAEPAAQRPVDVLAGSVDAGKRLLVEQAGHAVLLGDAGQRLHDRLLMVGRDVRVFVERRDLVLTGSHLIVPGLHRHAELEEISLGLEHAGEHPLGDGPEILVLKLLPLRRLGTEQRPPGHHEVGAGKKEVAVDEKVFLLRSARRSHLADVLVAEQGQHAAGLLVDGLHRAEQRGLLIQRLARPRAERRGDAERGAVGVVEDVGGARRIPGGVAAGFERGAEAARGEARCIGLALDQFLAGELGDGVAVTSGCQETVVLLGGQAGEGIEDVGVVGGALLDGPVLHGQRHGVGDRGVDWLALLDRGLQRLVDALRQPILHDGVAEHVRTEELARGSFAEVPTLAGGTIAVDGGDSTGAGGGHGESFFDGEGANGAMRLATPHNKRSNPACPLTCEAAVSQAARHSQKKKSASGFLVLGRRQTSRRSGADQVARSRVSDGSAGGGRPA